MMFDKFLYFFGLVRASNFDELRDAANEMQNEWAIYQHNVERYNQFKSEESFAPPFQRNFQIIQGGKT